MTGTELIKLLSRFSPFEGLSADYLDRVVEHCQLITVAKGKIIFRRGKAVGHRYYLVEGVVDLVGEAFKTNTLTAQDQDSRFPLTDSSPTKVSAVAKEACRLIRVEAEFLDIAMAWSQSTDDLIETMVTEDIQTQVKCDLPDTVDLTTAHVEVDETGSDWMSSLLQSSQFMRIPPANIQKLFQCFESKVVAAGEVVVKEGEAGDYFYILERGQAKVTRLVGNLDVTLSAGSYFGEEALVADAPRNASVTMLSNGLLMRINKDNFTTLMQQPAQKYLTFAQLSSADYGSPQLVDVRMSIEYRHVHVPGAINIPVNRLRKKIPELNSSTLYVVTDDGGRRAELAAYLMCQLGLNACLLKSAHLNYPASD